MRKTKIVALLLVVALIASMVVPGVSAAEDYAIKVTDFEGNSAITAKAGDEISVRLSVAGNPGISGLALYLTYPEAWENTFVINKKLFNDAAETTHTASPNLSVNPYFVNWIMPYGTTATPADRTGKKLSTDNGALLDVYILIPANTPSGTYEIGVTTAGLEGSNFAEQVDANGVIVPGGQTSLVIPDTSSKLTITVEGDEPEAPAATPCEKCGEVEWTEVAENAWADGGAIAAGHYKLTGKQDLTAQLSIAASTSVCIDLNGYTIAATGAHRTFSNGGTLTIQDTSENETGVIKASESVVASSGANIYTEVGTFNLYGGTISGGHTVELTSGYAPSGSTYKTGGNLYISSGTANIYGGTITGGYARRGGNVFVNNGTFNMFNGTITLGVADRGGNVYSDGRVNVYNGTISNGIAGWGGGNLFVYDAPNSIHIYGGSILNGACKENKGNAIHNVYGEVYIYGGTFDNREGVNPAGAARTALFASSGSATTGIAVTHIYGGTFYGSLSLASSNADNKFFNGSFNVDVSAYKADCACMEPVDGAYVIWNYDASCTDCAYKTALAADAADDKYAIVQQTGAHTPATSGTSSTGYACAYCGAETAAPSNTQQGTCAHGDHGNVTWLPWDGVAANGHYYVENDMDLPGQVTIANGETLCLDLNGKTVTAAAGKRMFEVESGAGFNLMDLVGEGKLVGSNENAPSGAVVRSYESFNMYSGTILGGTVSVNSTSNYYAGSVYISGGTFNMIGGTISGGKVFNEGTGTGAGGNLYLTSSCTANITGGVIENGVASSNGGNISINTGAQVTISGNVIIRNGSAAVGDNIFVRGENDSDIESRLEIRAGVVIEAGATDAADISVNASLGEIAIYAGVTLPESCAQYLACEAVNYAAATGNYTTYATLTDALAAATAGDKVTLGMDATAETVLVKTGVTLDLNGKTLTAGVYSASFEGTQTIDSVGTAKLVTPSATFTSNNAQLPVEVNGVFTFETVQFASKYEEVDTKATYKFYIAAEAAATMIDDAILAGDDVTLQVKVTWNAANGEPCERTFVLGAADLALYAGNWDTKMIILTIADISAVTNVNCVAQVVANGVTVGA